MRIETSQERQTQSRHRFDLEERTLRFARDVIAFVSALPKTLPNAEVSKQLVRSAGSVGANYIEANESLGRKDFLMKIRISRKEAKESRYWLELAICGNDMNLPREKLVQEATELMRILGAILRNSMAKLEARNPKFQGTSNHEIRYSYAARQITCCRTSLMFRYSDLVFPSYFGFRVSNFLRISILVFRISYGH